MAGLLKKKFLGFNVAVATPRKLPNASKLNGRVVILDLAFAHSKPSGSFPSITHKLINQLGERLALFLDHHDSDFHEDFAGNPKFILATKAEHGACPEMITEELVEQTGAVDTILCHGDFDGLASAAKWILGGVEPYDGCDHDAWCIDTRLEAPSQIGMVFDRALRANLKDDGIKELVLNALLTRLVDKTVLSTLKRVGQEVKILEENAEELAQSYQHLNPQVAFLDVRHTHLDYDKTHLLLCGQQQAQIAVLRTEQAITFAAPFNSGLNFLKLFQVSGGMPTVISLAPHRLRGALVLLGIEASIAARLAKD